MTARHLTGCLLLLLAFHCPAMAHNGQVALAYPVESIVIDGDLSDWPDDIPWNEARSKNLGAPLDGPADFSPRFHVGYDSTANALYVGAEVHDDCTVISPSATASVFEEDISEVFISLDHRSTVGVPCSQFGVWGNHLRSYGTTGSRYGLDLVKVAFRFAPGLRIYEWRMDVEGISRGQTRLQPYTVVSLNVSSADRDADGRSAIVGWGDGISPLYGQGHRGDVVLVDSDTPLGWVEGRAYWSGSGRAVTRREVQLTSVEHADLTCHVETDTSGHFAVLLPAGLYRAAMQDWGAAILVDDPFKVHPDHPAHLDLPLTPSRGTRHEPAFGRRVTLGRGTRKSSWVSYAAVDGLPPSVAVTGILQDHKGDLWFTTREGGLVRYDGAELTVYTTEDGLAGNDVWAAAQDQAGDLWFGTGVWGRGGVSRFDGERFTSFTVDNPLGKNQVTALELDPAGGIWLGTYRAGATLLSAGEARNFTVADGLASDEVKAIHVDRSGRVWFGTNSSGATCYDGTRFISYPLSDSWLTVSAIAEDAAGGIWFGTKQGAIRYDGTSFTALRVEDGLANDDVLAIVQDRDGEMWFGTKGGVSRYDGQRFTSYTTEDGLANNVVDAICQDREGYLWFGTEGGMVSRFDKAGLRTFTRQDGLGADDVRCILEDSKGNLWFGTLGGGVSRYDGRRFATFTTRDGLASDIVGVMVEDHRGHIWMCPGGWKRSAGGTSHQTGGVWTVYESNVSRYAGGRVQAFSPADGLAGYDVRSLFVDRRGDVWFGASCGITRFDGQKFTGYGLQDIDGLSNLVTQIGEDATGALWFGVYTGPMIRYDGRSFTTFGPAQGLALNNVLCFLIGRKGDLWIGGTEGVVRARDGHSEQFSTADGVAHKIVEAMLEDRDGNLWFGSGSVVDLFGSVGGGVTRFDGERFTRFGIKDGLSHTAVHKLLETRDGKLLFGTRGGGVTLYDGQVFQQLLSLDGLPSDMVWDLHQDRNGDIWIATQGGLTRYRPGRTPPPVAIIGVTAEKAYGPLDHIALSTTQDYLTFAFEGKSFKTRPEAMVYRYRLKGYDQDWHTTHARQIEYQNLPHGDYTFEVVAVDRDLNYSEQPAAVQVQVHLPYERLAWFAALGLALGMVAWQGTRIISRGRQLRQSNAELSTANQQLHQKTADLAQANQQVQQATQAKSAFLASMSHELRTPMNAILNFSALILDGVYGPIPDDLRDAVDEIDRNSDHLLGLINDILDLSKVEAGALDLQWSDCLPQACLETAVSALEHRAREKGLALIRDVEPDLPMLWADERRLTQQVLLNLLRNALKFTEQGEIRAGARRQGEEVLFWVSDTGIGIPVGEQQRIFETFYQVDTSLSRQVEGTGLGLAIARRFVELHRGRIWVESQVGQGATFFFTIPLDPTRREQG